MIDFKTLTSALALTSLLSVSSAFAMEHHETEAPGGRQAKTSEQTEPDQSHTRPRYEFGSRYYKEAEQWFREAVAVDKMLGKSPVIDHTYLPSSKFTGGREHQEQPMRWYYFSPEGTPERNFLK